MGIDTEAKPCPLIEFRDITVMRGENTVLDGVTLSIAAGEHARVLSPSKARLLVAYSGPGYLECVRSTPAARHRVERSDARLHPRFQRTGNCALGLFQQHWHLSVSPRYSGYGKQGPGGSGPPGGSTPGRALDGRDVIGGSATHPDR